MNGSHEKIARILRVSKVVIADLEAAMERVTGKVGVMARIVRENDALVADRLRQLGVSGKDAKAVEVYDALISKVEADDLKVFEAAGIFSLRLEATAEKICDFVTSITPPGEGYFLKYDKAVELLKAEPPKKILEALGYATVSEMLQKENILEVMSALRFLEDPKWLNDIFFKQYEKLVPEDFELRRIRLQALHPKWASAAEKFVAKKYHNVSHLKELGVIFVIPIFLGISGETLRLVSLLNHYLHEVAYYASLFEGFMKDKGKFAAHLISALRGDVVSRRIPVFMAEAARPRWLIVQRYLAKDDENDWRLFEPHVNPEALHWQRAEQDILNIAKVIRGFHNGLDFWSGLGWAGDYFPTETGVPVLVSFNIVDTVMALVKEKELVKYLYHQQEALWNKIFTSYFSEQELEELSKKYIIQGWFEV